MQRILLLVFMGILLASGCAGSPDYEEAAKPVVSKTVFGWNTDLAWLWEAPPVDGMPVFVAVAPRMYDRERERWECLIYGATQASIYHYIAAEASLLTRQDGTIWNSGNVSRLSVNYNENVIPEIARELKILKEYQDADGTYMLLGYSGASAPHLTVNLRYSGGSPEWIRRLPSFPGYDVALGISEPHLLLADSIRSADINALVDLLKGISVKVVTDQMKISTTSSEKGAMQSSYEVSTGELRGFYILARWFEDDMYYSLAVCPSN